MKKKGEIDYGAVIKWKCTENDRKRAEKRLGQKVHLTPGGVLVVGLEHAVYVLFKHSKDKRGRIKWAVW